MPLVIIHSLPPADRRAIPRMLEEVKTDGARALGCATSNVWVMFEEVPPGRYVQGDEAADQASPTSHPPAVIAKLQAGRSREEVTAFVAAVAGAIGRGLSIPAENVWVHYDEMRPENVWFDGHWSGQPAP